MSLVDGDAGTYAANYEYGPFGETLRASGALALANPFRFSTKYQDDETDLYYYGYRYYNPETGKWLNRDPIGERGGLNVYQAFLNRPNRLVDKLGLDNWNDPLSGQNAVPAMLCSPCKRSKPFVKDDADRYCCPEDLTTVELRIRFGQSMVPWNYDPGGYAFLYLPVEPYTFGWYPENEVGALDWFAGDDGVGWCARGDTSAYDRFHTRKYRACPATVKALHDSILANTNGKFDLGNEESRNCAGWACERLEDAGIEPPWRPDLPKLSPAMCSPWWWLY